MEIEIAEEGMRIREQIVRVPKRSCISRLSPQFGVSDTNPYWAANDLDQVGAYGTRFAWAEFDQSKSRPMMMMMVGEY